MTDPLTLADLRVHYRPKKGLPLQIKQRRVTRADFIEVAKSLGGFESGSFVGTSIPVPTPGRYLVIPLGDPE